MTSVRDIEQAVRRLPPEELAAFRRWFVEFDAEVWDGRFEQDAVAGRLDELADEALRDLDEGRCTEL